MGVNLLRRMTRMLAMLMPVLFCSLTTGTEAHAVIVGPWTLSGPGTTTVDVEGNTTALTYALDPAGFEVRTWNASASVLETGLYQFDWSYSGSHAITQVTAFLSTINPVGVLVDEGPVNCCSPPSIGFSFSGSESFLVTAGQTIGFSFGGSNADANNTLIGTLSVTAVPLPPAAWLLLLALALMAFIARRGQSTVR